MDITLTISMASVMKEVAQKSDYVGAKIEDDEKAYDRIVVVDEDHPELKMFWDECRADLLRAIAGYLVKDGMEGVSDTYNLVLNMPEDFNRARISGMQIDLFFYYVYGIIYRWYLYTHKADAETYAAMATSHMDNFTTMLLQRAFTRKMYP